jgi:enoyl-CoA hydratase
MTDALRFNVTHHIGLITLDRVTALNALNFAMIVALHHQLQLWQDDPDVHAVVIRSAGGRAFCAGGDVRAIYHLGRDNHAQSMDFFKHEYCLNRFIHEYQKPYIALMDGITMGGGVGISLHGSHPVASPQFVFAMPETGIGFYPDIGASYLLSRCPHFFGTYLGLTGSRLNATEAYTLGLVKHVIDGHQFPDVVTALQQADLSLHAHEQVSDLLQQFSQSQASSGDLAITQSVAACFQYTQPDHILMALRSLDNAWSQETLRVLAQKSPLSLSVTLAQLEKAASMTLADCLAMDYCLTSHFMKGVNFYEGVRALLIDKDNAPHWEPLTLEEVRPKDVSAYFC